MLNFGDVSAPQKRALWTFPIERSSITSTDHFQVARQRRWEQSLEEFFFGGRMWSEVLDDYTMDKTPIYRWG